MAGIDGHDRGENKGTENMKHLETIVLRWLQRRQNVRHFDTLEVTYQDCMDMMFVLARRLDRLEKFISPESIRKAIADDARKGGSLRQVIKNA
jgi:hypothetical protein